MPCIKPKIQNTKFCPNPEEHLSGYKDYLALALADDVTTMPSRPPFSGTITGQDYATAVAATPATAFGATAIWGKLAVKEGSVKITSKPAGNLKDSSAMMTEIECLCLNNSETVGYLSLLTNAPLHLVAEQNNGTMVWAGASGKNVYLRDFSPENSSEKSEIKVKFQIMTLMPLYLPTGTVLNYVA
jgi:hypothetical protein